MTVKIHFETDSAAFDDWNKLGTISDTIKVVAYKILNEETSGIIRDINGNTIGTFNIEAE